jgi:hypothetical protein
MNLLGSQILIVGLALYLIGMTGIFRLLPSSTAVFSGASGLLVSAICLKWWSLRKLGRTGAAWGWAAATLAFPVLTVVGSGFLGFGVVALLCVGCFVFVAVRYWWLCLPFAPVVLYFGLSLWVTYFAARKEIRAQVWGGESLAARLDVLYDGVVHRWLWLDLSDRHQVAKLERLDQNGLVGDAKVYLQQDAVDYARGKTFVDAILALIPRLVWPDKPTYAGSGDLVSHFTGRVFSEGTSVGIGQVMELYVNFGPMGLVAGYVVLGFVVSWLDDRAGLALWQGRLRDFLFLFMVAQPLMVTQGNFAEMFPAMVGSLVLTAGTFWLLAQLGAESAAPGIKATPEAATAALGMNSGIGAPKRRVPTSDS